MGYNSNCSSWEKTKFLFIILNHGKFGFGPLKQWNDTDDWLWLKILVYRKQTGPLYKTWYVAEIYQS